MTLATGVYDIRSFGARGDGRAIDARAVQAAIDAAAGAGGGTVLCPPGVYRIGSILLKDDASGIATTGNDLRHAATPTEGTQPCEL